MSDETETLRRASDKHPLNIEDMIISEGDPKQRAFLIVLNSINNSLVANTHLTQSVSTKLEAHLTDFKDHAKTEEALMNKGRGMWKIAAWVIGVVQAVGVVLWVDSKSEMSVNRASITALIAMDARHDTRLSVLEAAK